MKKFLAVLVLALASAVTTFADEGFAFGVWFDYPKEVSGTNVNGIALGAPVVDCANLSGTSLALVGNSSAQTTGFQCALFGFNKAQSMDGVQLALVNLQEKQHGDYTVQIGVYNQTGENGVQIGAINNSRDNASFQFGFINVNRNGLFPVMIVVNFGKTLFD